MNHLPLLVVDDPRTTVALYRETNPMLEDGFWPNGREIWENLPDWAPHGLKPRNIREQKKEIILNNGARIKYKQCAVPKQAKKDAQGQETTLYLLDEATQLDWDFTEYLMSRLRSRSKHFSRMVMSCNPDPDHELRTFIDWWIDDDGYPIRERDGVIRYMYKLDGEGIWGDSKEELSEKTGIPEEDWETKFLSVSFVSATIDDNPIMDEVNPSYRAWLEGLNPTDKAQLLHGNWDARPAGASYFERSWLEVNVLPKVPNGSLRIRPYDLAATERSQAVKFPDPTACIGMAKTSDGRIIIHGGYHKDTYDDHYGVQGQYCKRSGARDLQIIAQAEYDGEDTIIVIPQDPAQSGKSLFESMCKTFSEAGFKVKKDPMPINKSKLTKFEPFATACENGLVYIVKDSFDKKTLDFIYKQLEAFNGERSTATRKDDFADVLASGFNFLNKAKVRKTYSLPSSSGGASSNTLYHAHKNRVK